MRPPLTPQTTSPATLRPTTRAFKLANEPVLVLEGSGVLEVEGESVPVAEGTAVFVEAGAEHLFTAYEQLSVLAHPRPARCGKPVVGSACGRMPSAQPAATLGANP
jgi:hypothetical protein